MNIRMRPASDMPIDISFHQLVRCRWIKDEMVNPQAGLRRTPFANLGGRYK
jgi:hypothetical protein